MLADPPNTLGATLEVESSPDLTDGSWVAVATRVGNGYWTGSGAVTVSPPVAGFINITVRDVAHAVDPVRFLRLSAIR